MRQIGLLVSVWLMLLGGLVVFDQGQQWLNQQQAISEWRKAGIKEPQPKATVVNFTLKLARQLQHKKLIFSPQGIRWEQRPRSGEIFAQIFIPKLGVKVPIVEGTSEKELERGVGHHIASVLPGEGDNAVLAGHNNTAFTGLGKLVEGDQLIVESKEGVFTYIVEKTWITSMDDRTVIVSHEQPLLTVYTCYPFDEIGFAEERYIVQSRLIGIE
ncbi:sortase [Mechercharimyces sp. CAU 1602]|uniref:sortase n=1 Tax=Mechercharimyces sp. CAU 1602 TaxID=2973933 RepID=UPI0021627FFB|nr:sortase [Mechercharimyces sp. CAU 1602]MCS1352788.1 sortase [Mechercharimyces sp. CAU 1602]